MESHRVAKGAPEKRDYGAKLNDEKQWQNFVSAKLTHSQSQKRTRIQTANLQKNDAQL